MAWQIYLLTDSALQVGLLGLARAVPQIASAPFGGMVADALGVAPPSRSPGSGSTSGRPAGRRADAIPKRRAAQAIADRQSVGAVGERGHGQSTPCSRR